MCSYAADFTAALTSFFVYNLVSFSKEDFDSTLLCNSVCSPYLQRDEIMNIIIILLCWRKPMVHTPTHFECTSHNSQHLPQLFLLLWFESLAPLADLSSLSSRTLNLSSQQLLVMHLQRFKPLAFLFQTFLVFLISNLLNPYVASLPANHCLHTEAEMKNRQWLKPYMYIHIYCHPLFSSEWEHSFGGVPILTIFPSFVIHRQVCIYR